MKKILLLLTACLLGIGQAVAGNVLTVGDVSVPQGGEATLEIGCEFDTEYTAFELQIALPEGVTLKSDADGYPIIEKAFATNHVLTGNLLPSNGNYKITCRSMENVSIPVSGALFRVTVVADAALAVGTTLEASVTACEFTRTADSQGENLTDVTFSLGVTDYRTVLDEASTTVPAAATGVDVLVKRTINAGEWSTICLPFAMTAEQVVNAFGDGVELGDFVDTESVYDGQGNTTAISILFDEVTEIEANHPYIIKVQAPITEFTADNVDINPSEDDALVEVDNGLTGRRRVVYGGMYGTYHAQTTLEPYALFLTENNFCYSNGLTKMKAFRAYFVMLDVLTNVENAQARVQLSFDGAEAMGVKAVGTEKNTDGRYYNLSGQRIAQPSRGLYIRNGKKIMFK